VAYRSRASVKPVPSLRAPRGVNVGERPCGVNSGMTPRVVFSEGRTPCVRVVRPNECQGISFPPHALKIALGPTGHVPRSNRCLLFGRAEPAPPGVAGQGERFCGVNSGTTPRVVFSEGRTLCVRKYGPDVSRGVAFPPDGFTMSRGPTGHMPRSSPCHPCGRAEPAPRGGTI
jgi:hypothetical protein